MKQHTKQQTQSALQTIAMILLALALMLVSCARGITPQDAANGKAKCGRFLK